MAQLQLAPNLRLPLDAITCAASVVGQRGMGKTSTAVVYAEEASRAGAQVAVCDPTGAWYGLRSSADGKGPGLPVVVFGGHNGDVPLEEEAGALVAELVVREGYSVVLDLELMSKAAQVRFMADFCEALYHANRDSLLLIVDEVHRFAPQMLRGEGGAAPRCLGALSDVVTMGRRKGLGTIIVTQRPAKVSKDLFEQTETLICHRLRGPNDLKAIGGWLEAQSDEEQGATLMSSLPRLDRGQAVIDSPEFDVFGTFEIREKQTYDSSATPKPGAKRRAAPTARADVDMGALQERMAETLERQRADDPAELRKELRKRDGRIAQLQADLEKRPTEKEIVEVPVMPPPDVLDGLVAAHGLAADVERLVGVAMGYMKQASRDVGKGSPSGSVPGRGTLAGAGKRHPAPEPVEPVGKPESSWSGEIPSPAVEFPSPAAPLKKGARQMLALLAQTHPQLLGRRQVAAQVGIKSRGSTFSSYLSNLRRAGLIVEEGDRLGITQAGFDELGEAPPPPPTPKEMVDLWRGRLKLGARKMLDELIRVYPDGLDRHDLADVAGNINPTGSTLSSYLSNLRTSELIDEHDGLVYLAEALAEVAA